MNSYRSRASCVPLLCLCKPALTPGSTAEVISLIFWVCWHRTNLRLTSPQFFPQLPQCHKSGQDFFTSVVKIKAGHFLIFFSWWLTSKNPDNLKGGKLIEVLILVFNFMIQVLEWTIFLIRLLKFYFLEWVETLSLSSDLSSFQSPFSQSILQWYFFVHTCNSFIQNDSSFYNSFQSSTVQLPLCGLPHCNIIALAKAQST